MIPFVHGRALTRPVATDLINVRAPPAYFVLTARYDDGFRRSPVSSLLLFVELYAVGAKVADGIRKATGLLRTAPMDEFYSDVVRKAWSKISSTRMTQRSCLNDWRL